MKKLTKEQAISLINWYLINKNSNWGSWGDYPDLPCGANYLQYDTNPCQVNLDESILVGNDEINCFIHSRHVVGHKWNKPMTFSQLRKLFTPGIVKKEWIARNDAQTEVRQVIADYYNSLPIETRQEIEEIWHSDIGKKKRKSMLWKYFGENNIKYHKYIPYILDGTYFPYTEIV